MADFTGQKWDITLVQGDQTMATVVNYAEPTPYQQPITLGLVRRIHMMWLDVDALPSIVYRTWDVVDYPDPTGVYYTGPKSGSTAISGAVVVGQNDQ